MIKARNCANTSEIAARKFGATCLLQLNMSGKGCLDASAGRLEARLPPPTIAYISGQSEYRRRRCQIASDPGSHAFMMLQNDRGWYVGIAPQAMPRANLAPKRLATA